MSKAILIVGHGSKSSQAVSEFETVVAETGKKTENVKVCGAHMELAEPSIQDSFEMLWNEGIKSVTVIPYFLFNGRHIQNDIPRILKSMEEKYEGIEIIFGSPIGPDPSMATVLWNKAIEANPSLK